MAQLGPIPAKRPGKSTGDPLSDVSGIAQPKRENSFKEGNRCKPDIIRVKPQIAAKKPDLARQGSKEGVVDQRQTKLPIPQHTSSGIGKGGVRKVEKGSIPDGVQEESKGKRLTPPRKPKLESNEKPSNEDTNAAPSSPQETVNKDGTHGHYYHKYDVTSKGKSGKPRPLAEPPADPSKMTPLERIKLNHGAKQVLTQPYKIVDITNQVVTHPPDESTSGAPPKVPLAAPENSGGSTSSRSSTMSSASSRGSKAGTPSPLSLRKQSKEDLDTSSPDNKSIKNRSQELQQQDESGSRSPTPTRKIPILKPTLGNFHAYEPVEISEDVDEENEQFSRNETPRGSTLAKSPAFEARMAALSQNLQLGQAAVPAVCKPVEPPVDVSQEPPLPTVGPSKKKKEKEKQKEKEKEKQKEKENKELGKEDKSKKGKSFFKKLFGRSGSGKENGEENGGNSGGESPRHESEEEMRRSESPIPPPPMPKTPDSITPRESPLLSKKVARSGSLKDNVFSAELKNAMATRNFSLGEIDIPSSLSTKEKKEEIKLPDRSQLRKVVVEPKKQLEEKTPSPLPVLRSTKNNPRPESPRLTPKREIPGSLTGVKSDIMAAIDDMFAEENNSDNGTNEIATAIGKLRKTSPLSDKPKDASENKSAEPDILYNKTKSTEVFDSRKALGKPPLSPEISASTTAEGACNPLLDKVPMRPEAKARSSTRLKRPPSVPPPAVPVSRKESSDKLMEKDIPTTPPVSTSSNEQKSILKSSGSDTTSSPGSGIYKRQISGPKLDSTTAKIDISGPILQRTSANLEVIIPSGVNEESGGYIAKSPTDVQSVGSDVSSQGASGDGVCGPTMGGSKDSISSRSSTGSTGVGGGTEGGSSTSPTRRKHRPKSDMRPGRPRPCGAPPPPPPGAPTSPPADHVIRRLSASEAPDLLSGTTHTLPNNKRQGLKLSSGDSFQESKPTKFKGRQGRSHTITDGVKIDLDFTVCPSVPVDNRLSKFIDRALPEPPSLTTVNTDHNDDSGNLYETVSPDDHPPHEGTPYEDIEGDVYDDLEEAPRPPGCGSLQVQNNGPPSEMNQSDEYYLVPVKHIDSPTEEEQNAHGCPGKPPSIGPKTKGAVTLADCQSPESYVMLYANKDMIDEERGKPVLSVAEAYHKMSAQHLECLHQLTGLLFTAFIPVNPAWCDDLAWSDFQILRNKKPLYAHSGVAYYCAKCAKLDPADCLIMISTQKLPSDMLEYNHINVISPYTMFSAKVPAEYFHQDTSKRLSRQLSGSIETTIALLGYRSMMSLDKYIAGIARLQKTDPEQYDRNVCYIMSQVINAVLHIQDRSCPPASLNLWDIIVVTSGEREDKHIIVNPHCHKVAPVNMAAIGKQLLRLLYQLLHVNIPPSGDRRLPCTSIPQASTFSNVFRKLVPLLETCDFAKLVSARNLTEFILWGPRESDTRTLQNAADSEQAFDVWVSLERCRWTTRFTLEQVDGSLQEAQKVRFLTTASGSLLHQTAMLLYDT